MRLAGRAKKPAQGHGFQRALGVCQFQGRSQKFVGAPFLERFQAPIITMQGLDRRNETSVALQGRCRRFASATRVFADQASEERPGDLRAIADIEDQVTFGVERH